MTLPLENPQFLGPKGAKTVFFVQNDRKTRKKYANMYIYGLFTVCLTLFYHLYIIKVNFNLSIVHKSPILGPKRGKNGIFLTKW